LLAASVPVVPQVVEPGEELEPAEELESVVCVEPGVELEVVTSGDAPVPLCELSLDEVVELLDVPVEPPEVDVEPPEVDMPVLAL
jgi:hypothetical protein